MYALLKHSERWRENKVCVASFPLKLQIFVGKWKCAKVRLGMVRGLPKTRATKLCDPPSMRNTIAHSFLERERKALPSRGERERESDSSLLRGRRRMGEHSQG